MFYSGSQESGFINKNDSCPQPKFYEVEILKKTHYSVGDCVVLNGKTGLVCEKTYMEFYKIQYSDTGKNSEYVRANELSWVKNKR